MTQNSSRFQRRIQRYGWDRAASEYETGWRRQLEPAQHRLLEMAALRPGERVLDVACGTGLVTFPAAEAVAPDGTVVATDLSDGMLDEARARAEGRTIHNVTFERMGAESLELPDSSFDVALCSLGLMYVPEPGEAVREMHRVLEPGGRAAAAVWGERKACGWAEIFPITDRRVESEVCPLFFQLGAREMLAQAFRDAGFVDVVFDRLQTTLRYESGDEACLAAFAGGPVALAYRKFDERTREEAHQEYLDSIAPYRDGGGYEIPGEFVVASGRRAEA